MKHLYVFFQSLLLLFGNVAWAQENRHAAQKIASTAAFYTDMPIYVAATEDQQQVKLTTSYNGWQYAAVRTVNTGANTGGITIRRSQDGGFTWTTLDSYTVTNVRYTACDIVVAGSDTADLKLFLVGIRQSLSGNTYNMFIDRYNATRGTFIGSNYNVSTGTRKMYDVAIASDYEFPAVGASPYSIGILVSAFGSVRDSVIFVGSADGGSNFTLRQPVMATGYYCRKVAIAYGRSSSASNGRYFGAYEVMGSSGARTGHIYASRSASTISGAWNVPKNLDSLSSSMINLCRNPSIAVSQTTTDNDSNSVSEVVLIERDYNGNGSDYDVLGFYNKRAHFTNFWFRLDVLNSGESDMQPDIVYNSDSALFQATYFDTTNRKLTYVANTLNLQTASSWQFRNLQYNDTPANLRNPYPQLVINPVTNQAAAVWVENQGGMGSAKFDAEYLSATVAVKELSELSDLKLFPNPTQAQLIVAGRFRSEASLRVEILAEAGQSVYTREVGHVPAGDFKFELDLAGLSSGQYIVRLISDRMTKESKIVIVR